MDAFVFPGITEINMGEFAPPWGKFAHPWGKFAHLTYYISCTGILSHSVSSIFRLY